MFFRREYLLIHLTTTHGMEREEAKETAKRVSLGYTQREQMETCGPTEKKLKDSGESTQEESEPELVISEDTSEFDTPEMYVDEVVQEEEVSTEGPTEVTEEVQNVEIISLSLVTIRTVVDGQPVTKMEHNFSTTTSLDPRNFDWRDFLRRMEEQLLRHAENLKGKTGTVRVSETE